MNGESGIRKGIHHKIKTRFYWAIQGLGLGLKTIVSGAVSKQSAVGTCASVGQGEKKQEKKRGKSCKEAAREKERQESGGECGL